MVKIIRRAAWFHLEIAVRYVHVGESLNKSDVDRNPFIEFLYEVDDFSFEFKSTAKDIIYRIDTLDCDDKESFQDILDGARNVLEKIGCVEDFDFATDEPHPTRGGDKLWLDIANSVGSHVAETEEIDGQDYKTSCLVSSGESCKIRPRRRIFEQKRC